MKTHLYNRTLQQYQDEQRGKTLDATGLYLVKLPTGGFTFFLGEEPLKLYTEPAEQPSDNQ